MKAAPYREGMQFRCVITNGTGTSVISNTAEVRLKETEKPPQIVEQPTEQKAELDEIVHFKVMAEGMDLTYQWQYRSAGAKDWAECFLNGYQTDTLTVKAAPYREGMQFRCVVSGKNGQRVISEASTIVIVEPHLELQILLQPQSQVAETEEAVCFVVEANKSEVTYQWQYYAVDSAEWLNCYLTGYSTDTLKVKAASYRMGMRFRCVITDKSGHSVVSAGASLFLQAGNDLIESVSSGDPTNLASLLIG